MEIVDTKVTGNSQDVPYSSLVWFFVLTFGISWGIVIILVFFPDWVEQVFGAMSGTNPLFILAVYGPAIAAFILVLSHSGISGLRSYLSRFLLWRTSGWWYAFILIGIPLMFYAGALIQGNLFTDIFLFDSLQIFFIAVVMMIIIGPVEEFGWRGFALPLLQRRYTPLSASIILGIIWGIWHLPAFFLSGTLQSNWSFVPFFVAAIAISILMTVMFNDSRGSLLLAILFHFQLNNPIFPDVQPYDTVFALLIAIGVMWYRWESLNNTLTAVTTVIPRALTNINTGDPVNLKR